MAVSRLFRHLILDAGLFLLVGGFLIVSTGWQPSWLRGQISSVCVDTDGWANILMWGKAIGNAMTKEDYCKDTKTNMEAYCTVTGPSTIAIPCPGACIRGVCYPSSSSSRSFSYSSSSSSSSSFSFTSSSSSSSRSTSSFSPPLYCTDSDSGLNYEVTGNVIDDSSGRRIVIWDTCMNNKTVAEAYCSQSGPTTHAHTCPGWCDGGRCVQFSSNSSIPVFSSSSSVSCTDSDSGQAFFSRGTAAGSNGRQITDICTDSKTLVEAYCAASGPATVTHTCPWQCVDGRCVQAASSVRSSLSSSSLSSVPSPLCTDSDNGIDYDRRGKVTWNGVDVEDICVDGKTIAERYCSESGPLTIIARCDEKCVNGACSGCPSSLVVYMDISGSMAGSKATAVKGAVKKVINMTEISTVTIVPFSSTAAQRTFSPPLDRDAAMGWVDSLMIGGGTSYLAALKVVPLPSGAAGIFLSDGEPNDSRDVILRYIQSAIGGKLHTVSIAAGATAERVLMDMADITGGNYMKVENSQSLEQLIVEQTGVLCE
ncbi:MAG: VWA domain-containing protein [Candidatus Peribacteraceae bacterium]|nr:VWA domain-containing protein [Candidatus Peribacteraceae bacterium]MDD5074732.1 VWA domain-containing protein [Candidatus Peribacteraceae bacterium]